MPLFRIKLMWALVILALLSIAGVNADSPSPAPSFSPAPVMSHAKAVPPTPVRSTTTGISPAPVMPRSTAVSPAPATPQSPAMSVPPTEAMTPAPDCMTQIYSLADCLSYVTEGSNATKPDPNCCPELAGMLDSNPVCLCTLVGKSSDLGVKLDLHRALKLPSVCGLKTPPLSMCSLIGIPVGAPTGSAEAPSSTSGSGMGMSPGSMGGAEIGSPSAGANGVSTSNSYIILPYFISALAIALLTL